MILVFDTETNGKARNFKAPVNDLNNWPRVVQLAWAVYKEDGSQVRGGKHLIKPDGWLIPQDVVEVHGITFEQAMEEGLPASEVISKFIYDYEACHTLVAHNIAFDYPTLLCEFIRYGLRAKKRITNKVCTMQASTDYCKIPGPYGYKWPKLIELHQKLFNEGFDGAHDAMNDVLACGRAYFELCRIGVIKPPLIAENVM